MKCDTLLAQFVEPFPLRFPVRQLPPREESCPVSGGNLQREASCSVQLQIYCVGKR